jgi:glutathione S-transferase
MDMKLYCIPQSPNSRKVLAVIRHLDLPVEIIPVNAKAGENRTPEYLAINPMGRMPTLVDGEFALWESNAIMQYLAAQKPESGLWPTEARAQAEVARWLFFSTCHYGPACFKMIYERFFKKFLGRGEPDLALAQKGEEEFRDYAGVIDRTLGNREWIAGSRISIADFALAAPLPLAGQAHIPVADFPNLANWFSRIEQLPAWKDSSPPPLG